MTFQRSFSPERGLRGCPSFRALRVRARVLLDLCAGKHQPYLAEALLPNDFPTGRLVPKAAAQVQVVALAIGNRVGPSSTTRRWPSLATRCTERASAGSTAEVPKPTAPRAACAWGVAPPPPCPHGGRKPRESLIGPKRVRARRVRTSGASASHCAAGVASAEQLEMLQKRTHRRSGGPHIVRDPTGSDGKRGNQAGVASQAKGMKDGRPDHLAHRVMRQPVGTPATPKHTRL